MILKSHSDDNDYMKAIRIVITQKQLELIMQADIEINFQNVNTFSN